MCSGLATGLFLLFSFAPFDCEATFFLEGEEERRGEETDMAEEIVFCR